jgi:hypothetical protein
MQEFQRKRGETASEWAARLRVEKTTGLTPAQLDELTLCLVQAAASSRRRAAGRAAGSAAQQCKKAVLALSAEERRRLARWIRDDLAG